MSDLKWEQIGIPDSGDDGRIIVKIPPCLFSRVHPVENYIDRSIRSIAAHDNFAIFEQVLDILLMLSHRVPLFLRHTRMKIRAFWPEQGDKIQCLTHTVDCLPPAVIHMGPEMPAVSAISCTILPALKEVYGDPFDSRRISSA